MSIIVAKDKIVAALAKKPKGNARARKRSVGGNKRVTPVHVVGSA
jgi:hypothetical protein